MSTNILETVGWVITAEHGDEGRIGYGQRIQQADQTIDSFNGVIGRTIYMHTDLSMNDIPYDRRVKWRSFSDDGDPAYDGYVHIDWLYPSDEFAAALKEEGMAEEDDLAYNIDRFNMT